MELAQLESHFVDIGGQFLTSAYDMSQKMKKIKAFIFDWDGVFNAGDKHQRKGSIFSEVDSMGIKMLDYAYHLKQGRLPITAIFCGEDNPSAAFWANREQLHSVYSSVEDKERALSHFCEAHGLSPESVAFIYDDIQDLQVAKSSGLRFAVGRLANPLLIDYIEKNHLADYISSAQGNEHAVRECTELAAALCSKPEETFSAYMNKASSYGSFVKQRQAVSTQHYQFKNDSFISNPQ